MAARLVSNAGLIVALCLCSLVSARAQKAHGFTFRYSFTISSVPKGKSIRVWFPKPPSNHWQRVVVSSVSSSLPLRVTRDSTGRDQLFFAESHHAGAASYRFQVTYEVIRWPQSAASHSANLSEAERGAFLRPSRLVPVSGVPADIAAAAVRGESGTMQKASTLYRYVLTHMRYDKSGEGWGRGDAIFACNTHRGNCTDFHSLFLSMIRSQQIPGRFDIGFAVPEMPHSGPVAGYHCWAEFWDNDRGWLPVDISEAWQYPQLSARNFGSIDAGRIEFSTGRDVKLTPRQASGPLNYFVYPYVEVGGKPWADVENSFSFTNR
jgi:transglutaminase-like putative cysteine protease